MAYTNLGRDTLWLYGGIVKSINRTVNKTLQGHIPEHVFSFVSKVCFVLAHCFTHPLKTKVFTSTLRLQNKAIGRFPRIYKSLRFTFNHKNLTFLLFSFPSQNRPLSNKKQLVHLGKLLKKKKKTWKPSGWPNTDSFMLVMKTLVKSTIVIFFLARNNLKRKWHSQ